jgi:hypothetical protein
VFLCVWARAYSADWSIFTMVVVHGGVQVLCCKQFQLCRDNLRGDEKGGGGGKFIDM